MVLHGSGNPLKAVSRFPSKSVLQQLLSEAVVPGERGGYKAECLPLLMDSKPLWIQQMFGADSGNFICLFIPLSQEEIPFGTNLLPGSWNELLTWLSTVRWRMCQPARGAACRACGACRECALTSEHLFLCPLVWILMCVCVCVELLFHTELGSQRGLLMLKDMAQQFSTSHSGVSALLIY